MGTRFAGLFADLIPDKVGALWSWFRTRREVFAGVFRATAP